MRKRALISLSDKSGVIDFAKELIRLDYEIISTGGTAKTLKDNGIEIKLVSDITGFPECLDGRVKTLHPKVHGAILARREIPEHMEQLKKLSIIPIDLVAVNLYPFRQTVTKSNVTQEEIIENIDIGGPAMLRSSAKNFKDVIVLVDPTDYAGVLEILKSGKDLSYQERFSLARKVFQHTASYDALIAEYFSLEDKPRKEFDKDITLTFEKVSDLRYGENPHQKAAFYKDVLFKGASLAKARQLQGKELSFNNINDSEGALALLKEFSEPTVVVVKHANPCAVASNENIEEAFQYAYEADPVSIFGGIVAINREITKSLAQRLNEIFLEVVLAPSFSNDALEVFAVKKNVRLLEVKELNKEVGEILEFKYVTGGILIQSSDNKVIDQDKIEFVTETKPTKSELEDMLFGMKVVKHTKSNAIVLAKNKRTVGIGIGQCNRITSLKLAIDFANTKVKGAVLASDAFFPFSDCVQEAYKNGISSIVQPGGSMRDKESIEMCDKYAMPMIFTSIRHFKH